MLSGTPKKIANEGELERRDGLIIGEMKLAENLRSSENFTSS